MIFLASIAAFLLGVLVTKRPCSYDAELKRDVQYLMDMVDILVKDQVEAMEEIEELKSKKKQ